MELDTTTFILELINFAVLVLILNHFLFRPVMKVMDERRSTIDKDMHDAQALRDEADKLCVQYEGRLGAWEKEKETLRKDLNKNLAAQREQGIEQARQAAQKEAQRITIAEEKKRAAWQRANEQRAIKQGAAFTAKLLDRLSGPELDIKLLKILLTDLENLPKDQRGKLVEAAQKSSGQITITTARALPDGMKQELEKALCGVLDIPCKAEYALNQSIISGLRVTIGPWVLQADLGDELEFFAGGMTHDG